jgi:hypothetical protein
MRGFGNGLGKNSNEWGEKYLVFLLSNCTKLVMLTRDDVYLSGEGFGICVNVDMFVIILSVE